MYKHIVTVQNILLTLEKYPMIVNVYLLRICYCVQILDKAFINMEVLNETISTDMLRYLFLTKIVLS